MSSGTLVLESGCPFLLLVMVGKQNQTADRRCKHGIDFHNIFPSLMGNLCQYLPDSNSINFHISESKIIMNASGHG